MRFSRTSPESGAIRTYTDANQRFQVSLWTSGKRTSKNSWSVYDRMTGLHKYFWNRGECHQFIERLTSSPMHTRKRFLIAPRREGLPGRPLVLVDRVTGRWWHLEATDDVLAITRAITALDET